METAGWDLVCVHQVIGLTNRQILRRLICIPCGKVRGGMPVLPANAGRVPGNPPFFTQFCRVGVIFHI